MRVVFTVSFLLYSITLMSQQTVDSSNPGVLFQKTSADVKFRIRCLATSTIAAEPLVIIDGIPFEYKYLNYLKPGDIESISILKDSKAAAIYGCRAMNGVVIVTTKKARLRTFRIRDLLDGRNLPGATVSFISTGNKKDTLVFVSNDSGLITTDKLNPGTEYHLTISYTGYKALAVIYKNINNTASSFSLERDVVGCSPVTVSADVGFGCRRTGCTLKGVRICRYIASGNSSTNSMPVKVYPNPVLPGRTVTIEINSPGDCLLYTNVTALDGRQLLSRSQKAYKGKALFSFDTDSRWPAGVYLFQVLDDRRNVLKVEKIVISN